MDKEKGKRENENEREYARKGEVTRRGIALGAVFTYYLYYLDGGELSFSNPFSGISGDVLMLI